MSIEKNIDRFGKKLPIPYIEKIKVYDHYLDVSVAVYVDLPADINDKSTVVKSIFLKNILGHVEVYCSLLHDRNSDTDNMALYDIAANRYYAYPANAYSDVVNNKLSPLDTMFRNDADPESTSAGYYLSSYYRSLDVNSIAVQCAMDKAFNDDGFTDHIAAVDPDASLTVWEFTGSHGGTQPDGDNVTARWKTHNSMYYFVPRDSFGAYEFHGNSGTGDVQKEYSVSEINDSTFNYEIPIRYHCSSNIFYFGAVPDDFTLSETMQRKDGTARLKYVKSITIGYDADSGTEYDYFYEALWQNRGRAAHGTYVSGDAPLSHIPKAGIVAFSSNMQTMNSQIRVNTVRDAVLSTGDPEGELFKSKISACNFKTFLKNGEVYQEPGFVYTDDLGETYREAIQTINGRFYAANELKSSDIVSTISGLVAAARSAGSVSSMFEGTLNGIDGILRTYGDSSVLLIELNKFRKTMPDKSNTTPAGVFHERFKTLLFNANKAYKQKGIPVRKTLVNNPVVQDLRSYTFGDPIVSDMGDHDPVLDFIDPHTNAVLWSRYTEVVDWDVEVEELEESLGGEYTIDGYQYHYNLIDHGFWFFNYEKALKVYSSISKVLDVSKYEKYFGTETTNGNYLMHRSSVAARLYYETDGDYVGGIISDEFFDGEDIDPSTPVGRVDLYIDNSNNGPENDFMVYHYLDYDKDYGDFFAKDVLADTADLSAAGITDYVDSSFGGAPAADQREYSFLALRNFALFSKDENVDPMVTQETMLTEEDQYYRLACFEYQKCDKVKPQTEGGDVYSGIDRYMDYANNYLYFRFMLTVFDSTHKIGYALVNNWNNLTTELEDYINAANDFCSYNETDGFFNQFFIDSVYSKYPNRNEAPYVKAAILFHIMNDIINDSSEGDQSIVYIKAKSTILNIGPEAGSLDALNAFKENWDDLTDTISAFTDELTDEDTEYIERDFGGSNCNYIPRENYQFEPEFVITEREEEEVEEEEEEDEWTMDAELFDFDDDGVDDCTTDCGSGYSSAMIGDAGACIPSCSSTMRLCKKISGGGRCDTYLCSDAGADCPSGYEPAGGVDIEDPITDPLETVSGP